MTDVTDETYWRRKHDSARGESSQFRRSPSASPPDIIDIEIDGESFHLGQRIGHGRLGPLFEGRSKSAGTGAESSRLVVQLIDESLAGDAGFIGNLRDGYLALHGDSHGNIAGLLALEERNGTYVLVTEFVDGIPVQDVLSGSEPLSFADTRAVVRCIGEALTHLHGKGMVHGQVDERTVMLTPELKVRLVDIVPLVAGSDTSLMDAIVDDVFGLACLAYQLLTGRHPYDSRSAAAARAAGLTPDPIAFLDDRHWHPLLRALSADSGKRTGSVFAFMKQFEVLDAGALSADSDLRARVQAGSRMEAQTEAQTESQTESQPEAQAATFSDEVVEPEIPTLQNWAVDTADLDPVLAVDTTTVESEIGDDSSTEFAPDEIFVPKRSLPPPPKRARPWGVLGVLLIAILVAAGWVFRSELSDIVAEIDVPRRAVNSEPVSAQLESAPEALPVPAPEQASEPEPEPEPEPADIELPAAVESQAEAVARAEAAAQAEAVARADAAAQADAAALAETADPLPEEPAPGTQAVVSGPESFEFAVESMTAMENAGAARVEIRRVGDLSKSGNVGWWTSDGSAVADEDFADLGDGIASFEPSQSSHQILIPLINNNVPERLKVFQVHLGDVNVPVSRRTPINSIRVEIVDDD